ncbi:MAG TPA: MFS transporter [Candidatus Bilamarchaeum sp.]|nr:MFS transporter [Candidatus Bilamarchaeum sp.]
MLDSFRKLLIVYVLWLASWMLAATLFEVYFFGLGMSPQEIYLANALWFAASLVILPFLRGFSSKAFMIAGILVALASTILLAFYPSPVASYAFRLLVGMTNVLFWLPFNVLYYEYRKENNAQLGALYYSLGPVLSLLLPTAAGLLAGTMGFQSLYILAASLFVLTLAAAALFVEDRKYQCDFVGALRSISGLKSILFLEGFAAMIIVSVTLEVMLLGFITTPAEFGGFISLATIFSVVAAIAAAKLSDKAKERRRFLLPTVFAFALSSVFAALAGDIVVFFFAFGLINFFSRVFFPLPLALAVDNSKSLPDVMAGREVMLNAGRLAGGLLGYVLFVLFDIRTVLLFQGLTLLLYVPIFENRKRKLRSH